MLIWADKQPRMRGDGDMFRFGDEVPKDHFSESELASLIERGKVKVDEPKLVNLKSSKPAEPVAGKSAEPVAQKPAEPVAGKSAEPVAEKSAELEGIDEKPKPKRKTRSKSKGW